MVKDTVVFALTSSTDLAAAVCQDLNLPLGKIKVEHFADGEILVEPQESVRGRSVFIIQSTCNPVTDRLMEVLVCIDACKRASAGEINVIMPYYGYARQDRKAKPRQPITSKLVADLLTTAGVDRVVTVDLHAKQIQGFFDIPVDEMQALPLICKYFKDKGIEDIAIVSPDHGGATRARQMSEYFDCPIAIIDKRRPKPNVAEVMGIIGDVAGRNCILIDDMIDTAGTITAGVNMLKQKGAKDVYIACTHGVLSGPAVERLKDCDAKEVVITDTIPLPEEKQMDKFRIVTVAELLAHTIDNIENDLPVSDVVKQYGMD